MFTSMMYVTGQFLEDLFRDLKLTLCVGQRQARGCGGRQARDLQKGLAVQSCPGEAQVDSETMDL
jgi:hypothetical protein